MNNEPPRFIYVPQDDRRTADGSAQVLIWGVAAIGVFYIVATLEEWHHNTVVWLAETRNSISMAVEDWYNSAVTWLTETGIDIYVTVEGWYHAFVAWLSEAGAYIASFWPFRKRRAAYWGGGNHSCSCEYSSRRLLCYK